MHKDIQIGIKIYICLHNHYQKQAILRSCQDLRISPYENHFYLQLKIPCFKLRHSLLYHYFNWTTFSAYCLRRTRFAHLPPHTHTKESLKMDSKKITAKATRAQFGSYNELFVVVCHSAFSCKDLSVYHLITF